MTIDAAYPTVDHQRWAEEFQDTFWALSRNLVISSDTLAIVAALIVVADRIDAVRAAMPE